MADNRQPAGPDRLTITSTSADGTDVISVRGEIDHDTGDPLRRALTLPDGRSAPRLVVDLGGVTFMDSSGINLLITAHQSALAAEGWLRLAAPTESVLRTLRLVGLDTVIACYPTVREAIDG